MSTFVLERASPPKACLLYFGDEASEKHDGLLSSLVNIFLHVSASLPVFCPIFRPTLSRKLNFEALDDKFLTPIFFLCPYIFDSTFTYIPNLDNTNFSFELLLLNHREFKEHFYYNCAAIYGPTGNKLSP